MQLRLLLLCSRVMTNRNCIPVLLLSAAALWWRPAARCLHPVLLV